MVHMLLRPVAADAEVTDLPDVNQTCDIFADAFVRAVGVDPVAASSTRPAKEPSRS